MFTDNPVTPVRLEVLLEVLHAHPRGLKKPALMRLLQPEALAKQSTASADPTLTAAKELKLVKSDDGLWFLTDKETGENPRAAILAAFDQEVLTKDDVEPYLALFFALCLGSSRESRTRAVWAKEFNEVLFPDTRPSNQFNQDKVSAVNRWFDYLGLGWFDSAEEFQPCPVDRLARSLPKIFKGKRKLSSDEWMERMGEVCPELDGGELFRRANPHFRMENRVCSLGLAQALLHLETEKLIEISRPADSAGWSIEKAKPRTGGGAEQQGYKISFIQFLGGAK